MHGRSLLLLGKRFSYVSSLPRKALPTTLPSLYGSTASSTYFDGTPSLEQESVNQFTSLLKGCHDHLDLHKGRQIHAQIIANGVDDNSLSTRVLGMYVLCRSFLDAWNLFCRIDRMSPLPWNWMIRGFAMMGWFDFALLFYFKMFFSGALPDKYTFPYVIKSCSSQSAIGLGRLVHGTIRSMGLDTDLFVGSALIKMYAENDCIGHAREVFDRMSEGDCVLWNVMIDGYVRNGDLDEAIQLFSSMRGSETRPNYVSFVCLLSVCAAEGMLGYGTQLHGLAIKCGVDLEAPVANTLLAMYSKCQCLADVHVLFDSMLKTDTVTWNGMISGYVQNGLKDEALDLFYRMQATGVKPDSITLVSLLPLFSDSNSLRQGKEIHAYITRNGVCLDAFLKSALIDIYFKCKDVRMAQKVFDASGIMDVVICSVMISGYVLNGMNCDALEMFHQLLGARIRPNAVTLASVLPACACLAALRLGKELHCYIIKNAFEGRCYVDSSLSDMYAKCGRLDLANQIFLKMCDRDAVAWNSMIASLTQNGQPEEAIGLFRQMGVEGMRYDCVTISSALSACASLPALHYGKEIHGFMMRGALRSDLFAESALIDMYAKCGNLDLARHVFDLMPEKNEVSWNSIIAAYGTHGLLKDSVNLLRDMEEAGYQPDHITFLAIISACGHAGQVEEGFLFFDRMRGEYNISARMEHYACMVDLFGRAGWLDEALKFIISMPFKADAGIWGTLLGASRVHRNVEIAELASRYLFELDPQNSGYYVLMSNIHALAGKWEGVLRVRSLMKERRVQKLPGCSWIEVNSTTHMFIAADRSHPASAHIYMYLKSLLLELKAEGYVPQKDLIYPLPMDANKQVFPQSFMP